jgi:hypothetical protein
METGRFATYISGGLLAFVPELAGTKGGLQSRILVAEMGLGHSVWAATNSRGLQQGNTATACMQMHGERLSGEAEGT